MSLPSALVFDANLSPEVSELEKFVTVGILASSNIGDEYKFNAINETETITVSRITTLSVNAYGNNAYILIEKLNSALKTSAIKSKFRQIGAAVLSCSSIRNLPVSIAGGFEQRAQIDINLSHIHRITSQVNRAETVDISAYKG